MRATTTAVFGMVTAIAACTWCAVLFVAMTYNVRLRTCGADADKACVLSIEIDGAPPAGAENASAAGSALLAGGTPRTRQHEADRRLLQARAQQCGCARPVRGYDGADASVGIYYVLRNRQLHGLNHELKNFKAALYEAMFTGRLLLLNSTMAIDTDKHK